MKTVRIWKLNVILNNNTYGGFPMDDMIVFNDNWSKSEAVVRKRLNKVLKDVIKRFEDLYMLHHGTYDSISVQLWRIDVNVDEFKNVSGVSLNSCLRNDDMIMSYACDWSPKVEFNCSIDLGL